MKVVRDILLEAKADNDKLIAYVGEDEANRFFKMKDRLKGSEKDLYYWLKKEPQELTDRLDELENEKTRSQVDREAKKGAELVAENDYYKVYKINTFEAAKKYGANTKWCITGKESGWVKDENENKYWKQYTGNGIEFYFFISKKDNHKYAVASHPNRRDNPEIFDEIDRRVNDIPNAPDVKDIYISKVEVNGLFIGGDTVVSSKKSLDDASIPSGLVHIGNEAFSYNRYLKSVTIPDSIISIGDRAFYNCYSLTNIAIPGSVTSIGIYAFTGCASLTSIIIPSRVGTIEEGTFDNCIDLTSITIPNSITSIGYGAFYYCTNLKDIRFAGTKAQWNAIIKGTGWDRSTGDYTVHCTDGDIKKEANESLTEGIITEIYPNKGESKKDFISRFMSATKDEYPDEKQRIAVAYSYWDRRDKKEDMKVIKEEVQEDTTPTERGLSSVLSDLIKAQWDIVDQYNSAIATFEYEEYNDYLDTLKDLVADETANIGMLEGLIQRLDPMIMIDQGKAEVGNKEEIG